MRWGHCVFQLPLHENERRPIIVLMKLAARITCLIKWIPLLLLAAIPHFSFSQNYVFAQLTGAPMNTAGWNLQGDARVANILFNDQSELRLCSLNGASGAIFYNQPINLSLCNKWKAEFDFRMHDGSGADGLAFCFLDVPPNGFVTGGGLGIPSSANGLKVCFDTWNNCDQGPSQDVHKDMPKIELRWGAGYDECAGQPTKMNSNGGLSFIASTEYKHAKITYDNGNIGVYVNDSLYLTGYQQFNYYGYLGFTASTGGYNDNHSLRNVVIYTEMPPSTAATGSTAFCPGKTVQLGTTNNPLYVYEWSPAAGLNSTTISNPVLQLDNKSAVSENHTYYVKTSYANNPGCSSIDSVVVKVYPAPLVNFTVPKICLNDAIAQFTDSSYSGELGFTPFSYQWKFGDPNANAVNPNTATATNASHRYSAAANYNVQLTVTNNKGCTDSVTKVFTVNGAVPKAAFTLVNPPPICNNKTVTITNGSNVDFGSITRVVIAWGDSIGILHTDNSPYPGKQYVHQYPSNQQTPVANYTVLYIAYSGLSCYDQVIKTVSILQSPKIVFDPIASVCNDAVAFQLTEAKETTGLPGAFNFISTAVSANGLVNPKTTAGTYPVQAIYTANNTCRDSAMQSITIHPLPTANAGPDLFALRGGSVFISNSVATGTALRYLWQPAIYLDNDTVLHPMVTPAKDTSYQLTVTGIGGCQTRDTVHITVLENPNVPNAFTPNGDGLNDTWKIRYLDTYVDCTVDIYNRLGEHIFHSVGYKTPWDGRYKGKPVASGAYTYIINTKKHLHPFVGQVLVIR